MWVFEGQWKKGCEKIATQMGCTFQVGNPSIRQTLHPYDCMVFLFVLKHSNALWKLIIRNIQLNDQVLMNMCEELVSIPNLLYSLTIEKTSIQSDMAVMLGNIVRSQLKLTCLTITQTDLDDTTVSTFCDSLADHKALENLDVSRNNLTAAGALSLSFMLPKLVTLKHFNVSHNNIGIEGYNYIVNAINKMENCPLQVLQLPVSPTDTAILSSLVNNDIYRAQESVHG